MTSKIHLASQQLNKLLTKHIGNLNIDDSSNRLKLVIDKGVQIFIRYNNHGEYAYVIQFSLEKFDQIRYDNFDNMWNVSTKPHHCHLRYNLDVEESPFIGDPIIDMPILAEMVLNLISS